MEQKFRHLDRKSLAALLLIIIKMIKADSRIDADEIKQLTLLENQYGFDRTLMNEASQLTVADAVERLKELDKPMREQIMKSLTELASLDRVMERHEAMLLLTMRMCLMEQKENYQVISSPHNHRGDHLGTYILYFENETNKQVHEQLDHDWELQTLRLQQSGLTLFYVENIVKNLCKQDQKMVKKLLGYLAPRMSDEQIEMLYERMCKMDTATFCREILIKSLEMKQLRKSGPSLLINLGTSDFLQIKLTQSPLEHIREFLANYSELVSPSPAAIWVNDDSGHFSYYSYYRDFFGLLVQAEPKESRIVLWPNKSEFTFPGASCTLRLNPQEASLYSLILTYTYKYNKQGLPLSFDDAKELEKLKRLYIRIYCKKKFVDEEAVIYPDPLAPIRAKIEKKMREQLEGLDNLEDFIPRNENREGYYRITAPAKMVCVRPDLRKAEVSIEEWEW